MKRRGRRFIENECNHIYQRTVGGVNLFYDREDFLVFYMIVSVMVRKYKVYLLEMCLMVDHIHILLEADNLETMADFVRDYTSVFAREYNLSVGRNGQLFYKSYGSAPKKGAKRTRSTIVYIGNNPVEKSLCAKAEDYRWNFLKYIVSRNPFSECLPIRRHSRSLSRAIRIVNASARSCNYLNYTQMYRMFHGLKSSDKEILTDHIISEYSPFSNDRLLKYYDHYSQMLDAMHSTSGAEHDIKEFRRVGSDQIYIDMISYLRNNLSVYPVRKVITMPNARKLELAALLKMHTGATMFELSKFLHLK